MNLDLLLNLLDQLLIEIHECPLKPVEILLLEGIWEEVTYSKIGQKEGYSTDYLTNVVAPKLYKKLSKLIGKSVTKRNCHTLLESYVASIRVGSSSFYPSGPVPLNSPLYIERPPVEAQTCEEIDKPGALIRIKAPKEMGKTSLMLRILDHATSRGYQTVIINFAQIDSAILGDLDRFLRFLCVNASQQLNLESNIEQYWDQDMGSKVSCSLYFRYHLLEQVKSPIVLTLDELNRIFEYPKVAKDLLPLLRSWYEDAKRTPIWQNLRLVVVHSTEVYIPLQVNQSPFNVGLPIQLKSFNTDQIMELAKRYEYDCELCEEGIQLIDLVGGHPALIQIALYHLSRAEITLSKLLQTAATPEGIYHQHLRLKCHTLQQETELVENFNLLLNSNQPIDLEPMIAYKLSSMGLIKQIDDSAIVSCKLYQIYFTKNFNKLNSHLKQ